MSLLATFILDGDKLSWNQLRSLVDIDSRLPKANAELILFFARQPNQESLEILNHYKSVRCYWPKTHQVEPVQKAILSAGGTWTIFTSLENLLNNHAAIVNEVKSRNAGYVICRFNEHLPLFLRRIGVRDISATPYIAVRRPFALSVSDSLAVYNHKGVVKQADKYAGIAFVYRPKSSLPAFLPRKIIFFRPYVRIGLRLIKRSAHEFFQKIWSLPRNALIKIRARVRLAQVGQIAYDPDTPVFIITRDRLEPLEKLVKWIEKEGLSNIVFVDNASTYPPLLAYFGKTPYEVVRLPRNAGHKSPWTEGVIDVYAKGRPFIVTDPDVLPDKDTHGAVKYFVELLNKYKDRVKVGFALHINDLPDYFDLKQNVIDWESQFWQEQIEEGVYDAPLDTTFALYRGGVPHTIGPALRTAKFQARHEPWYVNSSKPGKEILYYRENADRVVGTWGLKKGDLSSIYTE